VTACGRYFVFEGDDGCGKDTLLESDSIPARVRAAGFEVELIREPYADPIVGTYIQSLLTEEDESRPNFGDLDPWQQAGLMNAARSFIAPLIQRARAEGKIVLASRNWLSTIAYQGFGSHMLSDHIRRLRKMCQLACGSVEPDLTVVIDIDYATAIQRMSGRRLDAFERMGADFHFMVQYGYRHEARQNGYPLIDGRQTIAQVQDQVWQLIESRLQEAA